MIKKILFVVLVLVLLTGCGPKTIKPGETTQVSKTQDFYFGVLVEDNSPSTQKYLQDKTEQRKIEYLVMSSGKYQVLPDEVIAILLEDTVWNTPNGVKVENPSVTLEQTPITWRKLSGNKETTTTVDGYKLVIRATIVTSSNAESGEVTLKMPQFKTLELAGLYVVQVDDSLISGILATGDAQVMPDSDTYVVAVVK